MKNLSNGHIEVPVISSSSSLTFTVPFCISVSYRCTPSYSKKRFKNRKQQCLPSLGSPTPALILSLKSTPLVIQIVLLRGHSPTTPSSTLYPCCTHQGPGFARLGGGGLLDVKILEFSVFSEVVFKKAFDAKRRGRTKN